MTLTELRYLVNLEKERHFGRAAERSFVSQPTLSVAIRKLEETLDVTLGAAYHPPNARACQHRHAHHRQLRRLESA